MPYYKKLMGERCYLSPCSQEDAALWAKWMNDLTVTLPLGDEAYLPFGLAKAEEDVRSIIQHGDHVFTIVNLADETAIGRCLLFNQDVVNHSAMLGIFIGEKQCWNKGYGQEALNLLLDYAFNLLNLHSVMLGVFSFNQRAIQLYRKVGFREIGNRREARIVAGKKYDVVLMDILEDEFRANYGPSRVVDI